MSTFQGLEMSKRALFAQQGALYTTGHNISNVNTDGYSRQRVEFNTTTSFPKAAKMMPGGAGQKGTGVEIGVIERIRNKFLDTQYRTENSNMGYWSTRQNALSRMESLMNEQSKDGLQATMDSFWESLQDLSNEPEDNGARSVVAERGLAVAETFNHLSRELGKIKGDLKDEINDTADKINGLLDGINDINKQIKKIEPHGQLANDLYDERDRLLDELSGYVNIEVTYEDSAESALDIADGIAVVNMVDKNGNNIANLLNEDDMKLDKIEGRIKVEPSNEEGQLSDSYVSHITVDGHDEDIQFDDFNKTGSLSALIETYGYGSNADNVKGDYPEILEDLNNMAAAFAKEFNEVHASGEDLNGEAGEAFFVSTDGDITANNITVNKDLLDNPSLIAATDPNNGGKNGDNATKLAKVFDKDIAIREGEDEVSIRKFYKSVIGKIGVDGAEAKRNVDNTAILQNKVDESRRSISAVSLDEEISNLVKFQHAYNAAARNMTTVDEMLDRIINQMGLVGR